MNSTETWFAAVVGDTSEREVARKVGLVQATLSRQLRSDSLVPENAVAIARAYGKSPVDALVAMGLITEREVKAAAGSVGLRDVHDEQLVDEILRRIQEGDSHPALTTPVVDVEDGGGLPIGE